MKITTTEAAELAGCSVQTIRDWITAGLITATWGKSKKPNGRKIVKWVESEKVTEVAREKWGQDD